jgi:plastocyanin
MTGLPIAVLVAVGALAILGAEVPRRTLAPVPHRHLVEIRGMAFQPEVLQLQRGDTVVWINRDIVPHSATATKASGWDTGPLAQGQSGQYVVRHQGAYLYYCRLHPTMQGKLIAR